MTAPRLQLKQPAALSFVKPAKLPPPSALPPLKRHEPASPLSIESAPLTTTATTAVPSAATPDDVHIKSLNLARARVAQLEEEVFSLRAEMACQEAENQHLRRPAQQPQQQPQPQPLAEAASKSRLELLEARLAFQEKEARETEAMLRLRPALHDAGVETGSASIASATPPQLLVQVLEECFGDMLVLLRFDADLDSATTTTAAAPAESPLHLSRHKSTISPFALLSRLQLAARDSQNGDDLVDSAALEGGDARASQGWCLSGTLCRQVLKVMSGARPPASLVASLAAFLSWRGTDDAVKACAARVLTALALRYPSPMPEAVAAAERLLGRETLSPALRSDILALCTCLARLGLAAAGVGGGNALDEPLAHMRGLLPLLAGARDEAALRLLCLLLVKRSGAAPPGWPEDAATHARVPCFIADGFAWAQPATALVLQHGDAGVEFLLAHGLLEAVANTLYAGAGAEDDVMLLAHAWRVAARRRGVLSNETAHRLLAGLLRARERRVDVVAAEHILTQLAGGPAA